MNRITLAAFAALTVTGTALAAEEGSNLGSVKGGEFPPAQHVIARQCTKCHTSDIIDAAISAKKDMLKIQRDMEKRGATLNAAERDVLGIFWKQQTPLKPAR